MSAVRPPLSLYVHLPWCVRKCPYCDFNSYTAGDKDSRSRYLDALLVDLQAEAGRAADRELLSVFLGGGTPSYFKPQHIGRLLDAVADHFRLAPGIEITMEANPGTIECGDVAGYRNAGVNRLSIGAQSFDPATLRMLGRIHSAGDIPRSFGEAREAGFANINLDLMYALPEQDVNGAIRDIEQAVELGPEHISWYQLTLEPNTVFHARPPAGLPDEDTTFDMQEKGRQRLDELGYMRYEVSAYARDGRKSTHNLNYWLFGDYLAVGAGAHGKFTSGGDILRYAKPANPQQYMDVILSGEFEAETRPISGEDRLFEFMLNALRLTEGFDEGLFAERTGLTIDTLRERLLPVVEKGLVSENRPGIWCATALGGQFLNNLQAEFLPQ